MLHTFSEINENINFLEENLHEKFTESKKYAKKLLSEHNIQSMPKFKSINKKISELFAKISRQN